MTDPGPALLGAALSSVRGAVERAVAQEARALADAIGVTPAAAAVVAAEAHLVDARTHAHALAAALDPVPTDLVHVQTATAELGRTVAALNGACAALGGPPGALGRFIAAVIGALAPPAGLADSLHLKPGPTPWSVEGTVLAYRLAAQGDFSAGGGPVGLSLAHATLAARLDWTTGRVTLAFDAEAAIDLSAEFLPKLAAGAGLPPLRTPVTVGIDSGRGLTVGPGGRRRTGLPGGGGNAPIKVRDLALGVLDTAGANLEVTSVLTGSLGSALEVGLVGSGLLVTIDPSGHVAPSVSLRSPDGGRIAVDAGLVRGGGSFTRSGTDYLGTLGVSVGPASAKAIALISTGDHFSITLLLFTELPAPLQLGFGFTLNGVGGLVAVNRALSTDAFVAHLHDGTIDALLFPPDRSRLPVPDTLRAVFPERAGAFAVGPAFELGWGVRGLVTAKVGVFVVLPDPRIVVLGVVRAAIPTPKLPIVDLRAAIVGEITERRLLVRVGLESGSRVAGYPLSGDVGVLVRTGDAPDFAFAAGGFHPGYRGPVELAGLRRLAIDLSPPAVLTARAEAYVALTSNAFMVGARVELGIDLEVADARGYLSFDAIVTIEPLHFSVDVRAGITVSVLGETVAGVALALHLEGPSPWIASGTATLELLFLPDIDLSFGPLRWPSDAQLPPAPNDVSALKLVIAAFNEPGAVHSILPPGKADPVLLRGDAAHGEVACHPLGTVDLRQHAVPLETKIATVGPSTSSEREIAIKSVSIGGTAIPHEPTTDLFAPGQFERLRDDERLSRAAFEPHVSGARVTARDAHVAGGVSQVVLGWETIVPGHVLPPGGVGSVPHGGAGAVLAVGAVARRRAADPAALYALAGARLEAVA